MRKLLTTLLLSLIIISVVGCSSVTKREPRQIPEVKVITEEVRAEIYQPPMPQEVRLEEVRWVVITKDNMNEQIADVEKMLDGDFVVFAMVPSDYENFAWNIQEIRRFIRQQKEIILYYREATGAGTNDDKDEWLEKNAAKQEKLQDTIPDPQDRPQSDEPKKQSILGKMGDFITNPLGSE
jgi:hypothetical protein